MSNHLTDEDREALDEALWGGRSYDDVPAVVEAIVARHVEAERERIAQAIEAHSSDAPAFMSSEWERVHQAQRSALHDAARIARGGAR